MAGNIAIQFPLVASSPDYPRPINIKLIDYNGEPLKDVIDGLSGGAATLKQVVVTELPKQDKLVAGTLYMVSYTQNGVVQYYEATYYDGNATSVIGKVYPAEMIGFLSANSVKDSQDNAAPWDVYQDTTGLHVKPEVVPPPTSVSITEDAETNVVSIQVGEGAPKTVATPTSVSKQIFEALTTNAVVNLLKSLLGGEGGNPLSNIELCTDYETGVQYLYALGGGSEKPEVDDYPYKGLYINIEQTEDFMNLMAADEPTAEAFSLNEFGELFYSGVGELVYDPTTGVLTAKTNE